MGLQQPTRTTDLTGDGKRAQLRWRLGVVVLALGLVLLVGVDTAAAVPGGPSSIDDASQGSWLRSLIGSGHAPLPSHGNFGVLNSSGTQAQRDLQINDPSLDRVQSFAGAPPFVTATQSETSVASSGQNLVVGYNSSAGMVFTDAAGDFSQLLFSAYSASHDGGRTWQSGFVPASANSIFGGAQYTAGDPSLGTDRQGNFYYAAINGPGLQISKSSDGGTTWTSTSIVEDFASDEPWLAIGPDPSVPARDDLYVVWTRLKSGTSELWMARSTDGGASWSAPKLLYAPVATADMSGAVGSPRPVVDPATGRLYISFLHFSNTDADEVKVMASDDGGASFHFLRFDVPGAPDPYSFPNVTPGSLSDCSWGGTRLVLHQGSATTGSWGLPRWVQSTRMLTRPAVAAANGRLFILLNSSTSPTYGAGTGSEIRLLYSPDGGTTWAAPVTVAPSTTSDPQHVLPAITVDPAGTSAQTVYYVQNASGRIDVESTSATVGPAGLRLGHHAKLAAPFDLPPTNITISPDLTLNYDDFLAPCYGLGEYPSASQTSAGPVAAWGGDRQRIKEPPGALISGVHAQQDVFFSQIP